jgi:O-antigen ligase
MERIAATGGTISSVSDLLTSQKKNEVWSFLGILGVALGITLLLILAGASIGANMALGGLVVLILVLVIIRWPITGFFAAAACAVLVEENPLRIHIVTDELNIFFWPPNLAGQIERPFGYLVLFVLLVLIGHNLLKRRTPLMGGKFLLPLLCFLSCIVVGIVYGLATGGIFKIITLEIRPLWYLFLSYLLAYNLVKSYGQVRAFFWLVIFAAGVKAAQGVYIYFVVLHGSLAGERDIMAHEESFFFVALLLLIFLFCVHHFYRPQFYVALLTVPAVFIALYANQRRTDYLALLAGMAVAWLLIFCIKRHARKALSIGMLIFVLITAGYVALSFNATGAFAEPARAIISIFRPDAQDAASNAYRVEENYDLKYTVERSPLTGFGFGKPFFEPMVLPDLSTGDPTLGGNPFQYVPHNTIYWIWMRLGYVGFFALWYLFGVIIIRGSLIARKLRDPYLQLVAIYVVAITFIEVFVAYSDYQLFTFRTVIYFGMLMGILLKLPVIDKQKMESECSQGSGVDNVDK